MRKLALFLLIFFIPIFLYAEKRRVFKGINVSVIKPAPATSSGQSVVTDGLIVWLKFADNLNDSSGNDFNFSVEAGVITYGAGVNGMKAVVFDGASRISSITTLSSFFPGSYTFDLWQKQTSGARKQFFDWGNAAAGYHQGSWENSSGDDFGFDTGYNPGGYFTGTSGSGKATHNQFNHVVAIFDGTAKTFKFYLNNVLVYYDDATVTGTAKYNNYYATIGAIYSGIDPIVGTVSSFKLYNRCLTDSNTTVGNAGTGEVLQNHQAEGGS